MTSFVPASPSDRDRATVFVGRVAQLDPAGLVRLSAPSPGLVDLWARGGFGVMATARVSGRIEPDPCVVYSTNLVAALAVSRGEDVDAGNNVVGQWHGQIPPADGWTLIGSLRADAVAAKVAAAKPVAEAAVEIDRVDELRAKTKATVPPAVLDQALMSVPERDHRVPVSMRMLFALSGMGFVADAATGTIEVRVTPTWISLHVPTGSVARRRHADLPPL